MMYNAKGFVPTMDVIDSTHFYILYNQDKLTNGA